MRQVHVETPLLTFTKRYPARASGKDKLYLLYLIVGCIVTVISSVDRTHLMPSE